MNSAAVCIAAWLAICALAGRTATARLSMFVAVALLPLPWFVSAPYQQRVVLAFAIGFLFTSAVDFAAGRSPATFPRRLLYVLAFTALLDLMTATPTRRRFDRQAALRIVAILFCGSVALGGWVAAAALPAVLRITLRMILAAALILLVAELTGDLARLLSSLCGVRFDPIHDRPYRSVTVAEFWSRRWNRMGARWFRQHFFVPLRRTSVSLALLALFFASAAMHVYLIAAVVTPELMAACAAFFLLQPPLLLIERRLRVCRWHPVAGRLWTVTTLTVLLPLVLAPLLLALRTPL